jgi:hypothetical protein
MKKLFALLALALPLCAQDTLRTDWASTSSSGSITSAASNCSTASACAWIVAPSTSQSAVTVQLSGTFTATLQFESSTDGATWAAITSGGSSSATTAGLYYFNLNGAQFLRVRASAYTSGPVAVTLSAGSGCATCAFTNQANTFGAFTQTFAGPLQVTSATKSYFTGSGNVLVGTTTDDATNKLQVTGSAKITGNVGLATASPTQALTVNGQVNTLALSTPVAPTVTPTGTTGATSYSYVIVAKQGDGSVTAGSTAGTTATGNATLTSSNYNALSWTAVTNAASYDVYRSVGGATQGKLTNVTTNSYNDQGAAGDASTAPTTGTTGNVTVASGTGLLVTGSLQGNSIYASSAAKVGLSSGGFVGVGSTSGVNFSSTANFGGTADAGISRGAAGQINIGNGTVGDSTGNLALGKIASYNGVTTVANGVPAIVAKAGATGQSASIAATTLYAVPAAGAGLYRASCYVVLTTAAGTSSTMPSCAVNWTDNDSSTAEAAVSLTSTSTANAVGTTSAGPLLINVKASTNIQYSTLSYASNPAAAAQYAFHIKLEFLGN